MKEHNHRTDKTMTDERLIEEAAKAIYADYVARYPEEPPMYHAGPGQPVWRHIARAALAVFEKAHTPTNPTDNRQTDWRDKAWNAVIIGRITPTDDGAVQQWGFSRRRDETQEAWMRYRAITSHPEVATPTLFSAGFTMGVAAAQSTALSEVPEPSAERLMQAPAIQAVREVLDQVSDRMDEHAYSEISSALDDIPDCESATATLHDEHPEPQGEPSDAPKRLVHEVNMLLSSVASHGPHALTDTSDRMYTAGLLRRLRDAIYPKPAQQFAAGNAVRAEMARNGLDVHRMIYGQEIANVLAGVALDAALRAASAVQGENHG
ncbi:hypothetical protein [Microbacterium sp. NPDC089696]|uniref:hypothetical protein n=1 Tax=Microbacterium sp. NPDC089696 TaxID=3364199 RepID=UPI00381D090B